MVKSKTREDDLRAKVAAVFPDIDVEKSMEEAIPLPEGAIICPKCKEVNAPGSKICISCKISFE